MAALPSNNTARLFVDYETQGHNHTLLCRFNESATILTAMAGVDAFLSAHSTAISLVTILGARVADYLSDVSYDVTWSGSGAYGEGIGDEFKTAWYYDYVGRSIPGRKARVGVFGASVTQLGDNFRGTIAEAGWIGDVLDALQLDPFVFVAIDGITAVWKQYANLGANAYWRNHCR